MLFLRLETSVDPAVDIRLDLAEAEQAFPGLVKDDRGEIVVEERPLAGAIGAATKEDLEGVVTGSANATSATVSEEVLKLGGPL